MCCICNIVNIDYTQETIGDNMKIDKLKAVVWFIVVVVSIMIWMTIASVVRSIVWS
tara:strand:+ start:2498 stop:2665 length:168 start_codon:yes stop_codon:yes gene_type:complete